MTVRAVEERCTCCDLPTYSCGRRVEERRDAEQDRQRESYLRQRGVVAANFAGRCASCDEWVIEVGDPIRHDGGVGWVGMLCCGDRA